MEETQQGQQQLPKRRSTRSRRTRRTVPAIPAGTEHASSGTGATTPGVAGGNLPKRRARRSPAGRTQSSAGTVPWISNSNMITAYGKLSGALTALYSAGVTRSQINEFVGAAATGIR